MTSYLLLLCLTFQRRVNFLWPTSLINSLALFFIFFLFSETTLGGLHENVYENSQMKGCRMCERRAHDARHRLNNTVWLNVAHGIFHLLEGRAFSAQKWRLLYDFQRFSYNANFWFVVRQSMEATIYVEIIQEICITEKISYALLESNLSFT